MSIEYFDDRCYLLSHRLKINQVLERKKSSDLSKPDPIFEIQPNLFQINVKYVRENQSDTKIASKKRDKINRKKQQLAIEQNPEQYQLINLIAAQHETFVEKCNHKKLLRREDSIIEKDNGDALSIANSIQDENPAVPLVLSGQNLDDDPVITQIGSVSFLIPPRCKFFQNDVAQLSTLIDERFNFVSIDPPWWNKYIRRAKHAHSESGYKMLNSDDIVSIPLEDYIQTNSIVIIWCTNSPTHISLIRERMLSKWNLRLISVWYWVKITTSGRTVCDFGAPLQKQPFEQLFVACHKDSDMSQFSGLERPRYMFSVPSAIHSHKPPIIDLFKEYLPEQPKCLEVFARYLMPGFTSIGLEVLKLQNMKLYRKVNE